MEILFVIIGATFLISLISFIGIVFLFFKEELLDKILLLLVAFAAGALMGGAFFHLLPEAIEELGINDTSLLKIFIYSIIGFCVIFVFEQILSWHHHHRCKGEECSKVTPFSYSILVSDGLHNFIDGLIIAGAFLVNFPTGIVTALAVAFHEIPQEIGDYAVLIYGGFKKKKALFLNFFSASTVVLGGVAGFLLYGKIGESIIYLLPFAAGSFIYIASSDLIPEIKKKIDIRKSALYLFVFLGGLVLMLSMRLFE